MEGGREGGHGRKGAAKEGKGTESERGRERAGVRGLQGGKQGGQGKGSGGKGGKGRSGGRKGEKPKRVRGPSWT